MGGFLNVDLEIERADDLSDVTAALEDTGRAFCLQVVPTGRGHLGVYELTREAATADRAIRRWVEVVRSLPAPIRSRLRRAVRKDLSVGVEAGDRVEVALSPAALRAAASIGTRVTIRVYPPVP